MRNFPDGCFQIRLIAQRHAFCNKERKRSFSEVLQQDLLALYGFQILGQIIQQIIFCFGEGHAQYTGHHQHKACDDDQNTMPDQPSDQSFHRLTLQTF